MTHTAPSMQAFLFRLMMLSGVMSTIDSANISDILYNFLYDKQGRLKQWEALDYEIALSELPNLLAKCDHWIVRRYEWYLQQFLVYGKQPALTKEETTQSGYAF